jgi:outer membrane biosynthesis protein TonB
MLATRNLNRSDEDVEHHFVQVAFTVGADGAVRDEAVIDQDATPRQVAETLVAVRTARYRPKFVNGEAVDTKDVTIRQMFRQRKDSE